MELVVDEDDGDLLPPQLVERRVVVDGALDDLDVVTGLIGQLGDDLLDDAERRRAQMTPLLAR